MTSITDIFPNSGPSVDLNEEYFADLKLKADGGDREAQFQLAQHYDQGPKGEENSKHAFELYKISADSGHEQAQLKLGHYFANGVGTEVDPQESFRYAKLSADQGNTVAQASIANFYKKGFGVDQSDENAMAYFIRAADGRHGDAAFAAGNGFYEGVGVPVDKVESLKYFTIAANQSHADAQAKCAEMHANGEGTEVNLVLAAGYYQLAAIEWGKLGNVYRLTAGSPDFCEEQRANYYALSVKHLTDAAESGDREAMRHLALYYEEGSFVEKNLETAFLWYQRSADKGDAKAQVKVGKMLDRGVGCVEDSLKAHEYFKLASENTSSPPEHVVDAFYALGRNYRGGDVVPQDMTLSFHYLKLAADNGDADSQFNVAGCYGDGIGCEQSFPNACKYYAMAAENGDVDSMFIVGRMYFAATPESGLEQNYEVAFKYWHKASDHGHVQATGCLASCYHEGVGVEKNPELVQHFMQRQAQLTARQQQEEQG